METIFQQAKFDEELDVKKCRDVFDEVRERLKQNPLSASHVCDRCGRRRFGISNITEGTFTCKVYLTQDKINRRYK